MEHFVAFLDTVTCEQETNTVFPSMMTCKIYLIWWNMKTPYWYWHSQTNDWQLHLMKGEGIPAISEVNSLLEKVNCEFGFLKIDYEVKHCGIGHLKNLDCPDLKLSHNVPIYSLFKLCKFYEKNKWSIFCFSSKCAL